MNLKESIAHSLFEGIKSVFGQEIDQSKISLQSTRPEFEGTYTFVIFPFIKQLGGNPVDIGNKLGTYLVENSNEITGFNVVKGFLNLVISDLAWINQFTAIINTKDFGYGAPNGKLQMVEFASPNTNKPLHLGHLRNIFLGDSVASILKAAGNDVVRTQIINDRGIHICKSMIAWEKFGNGATPESEQKKGDKFVGDYYVRFDQEYKKQIAELTEKGQTKEEAEKNAPILIEAQEMLKKWENDEPEIRQLWEKMNGWVYEGFDATYKSLNVAFDKLYYESNTYLIGRDEVMKGLEQGIFFQKEDGSVWVDLTDEGLDEKLLLRSDGTSVYMTQDIGTAILRFKEYPKLSGKVYTVGNEQEYHFKVLFLILKKLGFAWAEECYHLSYGMVELPSGKMKSREGTVVDADDLVNEMVDTARIRTEELGKIDGFTDEDAKQLYNILALGALKYYLLKVDPKKQMLFNPEESIEFQGNTGTFIQFAHARIAAILRKAQELNISASVIDSKVVLEPSEVGIMEHLVKLPEIIQDAASAYEPSIVANYVYDLAKAYNRFYSEVSIFNEHDPEKLKFRVALSQQVASNIKKTMKLLGIKVPEKM